MKYVLMFLLVLSAVAAFADERVDALVRLLNSRSAQSPKMYAEAVAEVRKAAESGAPMQQYVMAIISRDEQAPAAAQLTDEKRNAWLANGRPYVTQLAEQMGDAMSWYLLSIEQNDRAALVRAAEAGNVQAQNALGTCLVAEALALPATNSVTALMTSLFEKGFACYRSAAAKKDANGFYNLGMCYMQGYGCRRDPGMAFQCFRSAADAGHPEAICNIGGFYRDGVLVVRDAVQAARWFRKSAELGNAYGQLNYALALQRGDGELRNAEAAAVLLKASSEQGCAEAMAAYGMCFRNGCGVQRDPEEAFRWFLRSAEAGFAPAMDNVAVCYDCGEGTERDIVKSAQWKMRFRAAIGEPSAKAWVSREDSDRGNRGAGEMK